MNKKTGSSVSIYVRVSRLFLLAGTAFIFASCSGSRTVGAQLEAPPGRTINKTVMESDVFVPEGSTLEVYFSSRTRYFVEAGGALVGFTKGVDHTKIYAEKGALVPNVVSQTGFKVYTVKDASRAYRDRYMELLPVDVDPSNAGRTVVPVVGVGVGYWGRGYYGGGRYNGGRGTRPVSAKPSSYSVKH